jgi:hypothetical protein
MKSKTTVPILVGLALFATFVITTLVAEEPRGNLVLVAGETWGTYRPPNLPNGWPRQNFVNDLAERAKNFESNGNWIHYQSRFVNSANFGNPGLSWPFGKNIVDPWGGTLAAIMFDPSPEFAAANAKNNPPEGSENYSYLMYNTNLPGAGDPARDYVFNGKENGGSQFADATRNHLVAEAGWPTNVGIDVKLKVHSLTVTWGNVDDMHLVEIELYNTGEADVDGDGTVDLTNHRVPAVAFGYGAQPFYMLMVRNGRRTYTNTNSRYRGYGHDLTPSTDGNESPIAFQFHGYGSFNGNDKEDDPGVGNRIGYHDIFYGYGFAGALKWDEATQSWVEKKLAFRRNGEEVVPAVGVGDAQRGWFTTWQSTQNNVFEPNNPESFFRTIVGAFYADGGKGRSGSTIDRSPNANLFEDGTPGDITSFVPKDPAQWQEPDGAWERVDPVDVVIDGKNFGKNPIDPQKGRPLEPGVLTQGFTTEYTFQNDWALGGFGPFSLEVGERVRVFFVRGFGHRLNGLRRAMRAGRAVFEDISDNGRITLLDYAPAVPDMKLAASSRVKPLIMFAPVPNADGYKIYRSAQWPPYKSYESGFRTVNHWWKTMDPGNSAEPEPLNPLLNINSTTGQAQGEAIRRDIDGDYWGPYELVKVIPAAELEDYRNPRSQDASKYPYAWENDDPFTLPGQTFWYYVAAYKQGRPGGVYDTIEESSHGLTGGGSQPIDWVETGKVNMNGRDGLWHNTWPNTPRHAFFPDEKDIEGRKLVGAQFDLLSSPVDPSELALGRAKIVVRPNPYKFRAFHDPAGENKILFANLPPRARITILDVSGQIIDQIDFQAQTEANGTFFWPLFSKDGTFLASGVYIWVVEHDQGKETGVFSVLR